MLSRYRHPLAMEEGDRGMSQSLSAEAILDRARELARRTGITPSALTVAALHGKWGMCSETGAITLSAALKDRPLPFVDYVIVHELVHVKVQNHGPLFRSMIGLHLPAWRKFAAMEAR